MVAFRGYVSENGTRLSRFLADCNGVAADRISRVASRESFREEDGGLHTGAGISLPFGIHMDRLSPMLRLARAGVRELTPASQEGASIMSAFHDRLDRIGYLNQGRSFDDVA